MSRPLRIEYPDAWYHIMNRGRRSEKIFFTDKDREAFLQILRETVELWDMRVAAYCLMGNHYHLLVQTPGGNLSRCMRHVNGVYTQRFNRRHQQEGQLFRGRYKSVLVEDDSHLLEVLRYIHRNPLKAGIVHNIDDYRWSSHQGYLSVADTWSWLQKGALLTQLTQVKKRQKAAYLNFVSKDEPEEIEKFYARKNLPSVLGSVSFADCIREKFFELANKTEIPDSKTLALKAEKVISSVCQYYMISREELLVSKRGTANPPRDIAIYFVRRLCRLTLPRVGKEFEINNYSTVSSAVQRVNARIEKDKHLQQEINVIKAMIQKGQQRT